MNVKTRVGLLSQGVVTATANVSPVAVKGSRLDIATFPAFIDQAKRAANVDHAHVAIAIVDADGNLVSFQKMVGIQPDSVELTTRRVKTSVSFSRLSADMEHGRNSGNYMIATLAHVLQAGGRHPVVTNNDLVGAPGLSGGERLMRASHNRPLKQSCEHQNQGCLNE